MRPSEVGRVCLVFVVASLLPWHQRILADERPAMQTPDYRPQSVDWVRVGLLIGVEPEGAGNETTAQGGASLSLFGLSWQHLYLVPVATVVAVSGHGLIAFSAFAEPGWLGRWGDNQLRVGLGLGFGFRGLFDSAGFVVGAALRPAIRFRHYWGRFGIEVSAEVPLVVGPGGGTQVLVRGWSPLVGLSVGM